MSETENCGGCGLPGWTTEIAITRTRVGEPPHTIAIYRLCNLCAGRVEGNVAMKVDVHARVAVRLVDDDRR